MDMLRFDVDDNVLESNGKAFLMIRLDSNTSDGVLGEYKTVKVEVRTAQGAALTVVSTAPSGMPEKRVRGSELTPYPFFLFSFEIAEVHLIFSSRLSRRGSYFLCGCFYSFRGFYKVF